MKPGYTHLCNQWLCTLDGVCLSWYNQAWWWPGTIENLTSLFLFVLEKAGCVPPTKYVTDLCKNIEPRHEPEQGSCDGCSTTWIMDSAHPDTDRTTIIQMSKQKRKHYCLAITRGAVKYGSLLATNSSVYAVGAVQHWREMHDRGTRIHTHTRMCSPQIRYMPKQGNWQRATSQEQHGSKHNQWQQQVRKPS